MHAYVSRIEFAPVPVFRTKLNLAAEDSVFVVGTRKFQTK